jgi:hypothetical protein
VSRSRTVGEPKVVVARLLRASVFGLVHQIVYQSKGNGASRSSIRDEHKPMSFIARENCRISSQELSSDCVQGDTIPIAVRGVSTAVTQSFFRKFHAPIDE